MRGRHLARQMRLAAVQNAKMNLYLLSPATWKNSGLIPPEPPYLENFACVPPEGHPGKCDWQRSRARAFLDRENRGVSRDFSDREMFLRLHTRLDRRLRTRLCEPAAAARCVGRRDRVRPTRQLSAPFTVYLRLNPVSPQHHTVVWRHQTARATRSLHALFARNTPRANTG